MEKYHILNTNNYHYNRLKKKSAHHRFLLCGKPKREKSQDLV
jgi:hypothetical protein